LKSLTEASIITRDLKYMVVKWSDQVVRIYYLILIRLSNFETNDIS
ncbi:45545_t:CDS:1, partial [Gigaspora margarita]